MGGRERRQTGVREAGKGEMDAGRYEGKDAEEVKVGRLRKNWRKGEKLVKVK